MFLRLKLFLENIDYHRDQFLFPFIKKHWPRWLVPNHLTILRIVLAVALIALLLLGYKNTIFLVFVFVFASLLDLFDGSVARGLNKVTTLGAFLDGIADKILILPIVIYLLYENHLWLLLLLFVAEGLAALGYIYHRVQDKDVKANIFGKTKMVLECVGVGYIILFNFPDFPSHAPVVILSTAAAFAFMSAAYNFVFIPLKRKNA